MQPSSAIAIEMWTPPVAPAQVQQLLELLRHKGSPWLEDLQRRLSGTGPGARDFFYVAWGDDQLIGHAWYTVAPGHPRLGVLGHLFTRPDRRRQGVARRLLTQLLTDFRERDGALMQLFTSTPHSLGLYEQLGFESICAGAVYHDTDWYLRCPAPTSALVAQLLAAPGCARRRLTDADLPAYCLLYNVEHRTVIKDRAQGIGLGLEAELAFIPTLGAIAGGRGACVVLENSEMLVGAATLMRSPLPYESHVGLFDVYLHPAYHDQLSDLSQACLAARLELGVELVYAVAADDAKCRQLTELGLAPWGDLPEHYRVGDRRLDARLFRVPERQQELARRSAHR
jgi:GNAT superfamily N-acetyltransferase